MSDDEDDNASYGNVHRAFLQALLARKSFTLDEAKPLIAQIESAADPDRPTSPQDVTQADLDNYIHTLNSNISLFDFEIRSTQHQVNKTRIYALVNTTSDALTQMATVHTADEIAFVKRVLDAMFETYNTPQREVMAIRPNQALRLAKPAPDSARRESGTQAQAQNVGLTMAQAEKVLEDMVSEGWLDFNNEYYTLSPRALMELRGWLVDTYNTPDDDEEEEEEEEELRQAIKMCEGCKEIVTVGQRCPRLECEVRVHNHCRAGMFRIHAGREQCPRCKTPWVDAPPVGEKAARGARASNVNGNGRRRSSGMGLDGTNHDDNIDAVGGA